MPKTIGFNVAIGGDTAGLNKALKATQSQINTTSKAVQQLTRLTKFDPSNTQAFKAKQAELGKELTATKDKLEMLNSKKVDMDKAFAEGKISTKEWTDFQFELKQTADRFKDLEKETNNYSPLLDQLKTKIQSTSDQLKSTGEKIGTVGETATKNLTAPLLALGATATAAFTQYDKGADTIIQKTGASGKQLDAMQKSMENIAKTIPVSFEQSGTAIGEVNTRFGLTGDALEKLSKQFLEFSELNGTDVSNSIDTVQKAMAAFGVEAKDAGAMLDLLNKVGQDTGLGVDTLASSMVANAQSLKEMGFSASDAAVLLGNLEKSGIDTSTVMTGMKKVLKEAMDSGISGQEAFTKALSSNEAAIDIFGAKAGPMLKSAFDDGTLSMQLFTSGTTSLQDALGNVSATYESTLDPIDKFQTTMNAIIPVMADIGNTIMTVLQPVLENLCTVIERLQTWWQSLDDGTKSFITTVGLLLAAIGPIISVIGGIVTGIGNVIMFIGMLTSPIGIVLAAIAGVIAIIGVMVANWDTLKETAANCWSRIQEAWDKAKGFFSELWAKVKNTCITVWTTIQTKITGVWNGIKGVWNGATSFFSGIWNGIVSTVQSIKNRIMQPFRDAWNGIKSLFRGEISLPHIKLPHFTVSGSLNPLNWLRRGLPRIGVSWYAKAMDQPRILDGAQIFGAMNGQLLGGGESGREVVMSEEKLKKMSGGTTYQTNNITIVQRDGEDEESLAKRVVKLIKKDIDGDKEVFA